LGRCVTIGFLGKGEINASLNKQKLIILFTACKQNESADESLEEEYTLPDILVQRIYSLIQPQVVTEDCCGYYFIRKSVNRYMPDAYLFEVDIRFFCVLFEREE